MDEKKDIVSLHKLETLITKYSTLQAPHFSKTIPSFKILQESSAEYIKPTFTAEAKESSCFKEDRLPKVLLISAAGATGKSELTRHLSSTLKMPIFDLASHDPVGSNSLTGLFYDTMGGQGLATYIDQLKNGEAALMIDALDEGHMKTTVAAFDAFLEGVVEIAKDAKATPFILLGRTNIVISSFFYLVEKGVDAEILYIEPFTVEQAKEFIDVKVGKPTALQQQYREVRDHIIDSINGFFKNESEIATSKSRTFIGYAPVLLSISVLLKKTGNYQSLLNDLKKQNDKGIKLVLDIVALILDRDKREKVLPVVTERLLKDRDKHFVEDVKKVAYSYPEQCARILCHLLNEDPQITLTSDAGFNLQYNDLVKSFQAEHPFIQDGKLQNVVFESYVIAQLMLLPNYENLVLRYLQTQYKNNFMLFFVYNALCEKRVINPKFLPYLYSSLKSLDDKNEYYGMVVESIEEPSPQKDKIDCVVDFFNEREDDVIHEFTMHVNTSEYLKIGGTVSNIVIDAPIKVELNSKKLLFAPPVVISCDELVLNTSEFVIEERPGYDEITIDTDNFVVDYSSNGVPQLVNYGNGHTTVNIYCGKKPDYPFSTFYKEGEWNTVGADGIDYSSLDEKEEEKYLRLRGFLLQFRSHSKGELAKLKDKIEHGRLVKNDTGRKVLAKLKDTGVFLLEKHLYKINAEAKDAYIGLSYMALKRKIVNAKTLAFLKSVD